VTEYLASSRKTKVLVSFAIVYLVWGSTYVVTKIGVDRLPPFSFAAVRFLIGGALLYLVARLLARSRGLPLMPIVPVSEWRGLIVVGFFAVFVSNGAAVWGLQYIPSNLAALLNVTSSFWIPILGMFGARAQSISARVALGLVTGFAGTVLVAWPGGESAAAALAWPTLIVLIGCFGWSLGTFYIRNSGTSLDLMTFTALQMLCGGVMLTVPAIVAGELNQWTWNSAGLLALAYMTIVSSCVTYTAYAWLSVNVTPAQLSTYAFVNPSIALLLGWWVLDEGLGPLQIAGTIIILGGTMLVNWPRRSPVEESRLSSAEREAPPGA
jgi:drug/metabolite transporter (DMT)-like permease